jgi:hypothetical protein
MTADVMAQSVGVTSKNEVMGNNVTKWFR